MSKAIHFKIALISTIFILSGIKNSYAYYSCDDLRKACLSATHAKFQFQRKDISKKYFIQEKLSPHKNLFHLTNTAAVWQLLPFSSENLYAYVHVCFSAVNPCLSKLSLNKKSLYSSNSKEQSMDSFQPIGVCYVSKITSENQVMKKCI